MMDQAFHADETCKGCGSCVRVCPVGNMAMVENKPVWRQHCEQCFACLQWCPQQAIQFGQNTAGRMRYHHPDIRINDMFTEKMLSLAQQKVIFNRMQRSAFILRTI